MIHYFVQFKTEILAWNHLILHFSIIFSKNKTSEMSLNFLKRRMFHPSILENINSISSFVHLPISFNPHSLRHFTIVNSISTGLRPVWDVVKIVKCLRSFVNLSFAQSSCRCKSSLKYFGAAPLRTVSFLLQRQLFFASLLSISLSVAHPNECSANLILSSQRRSAELTILCSAKN